MRDAVVMYDWRRRAMAACYYVIVVLVSLSIRTRVGWLLVAAALVAAGCGVLWLANRFSRRLQIRDERPKSTRRALFDAVFLAAMATVASGFSGGLRHILVDVILAATAGLAVVAVWLVSRIRRRLGMPMWLARRYVNGLYGRRR